MNEILELIPQRPPMVMISGIERIEEKGLTSFFDIVEGNILVRRGSLCESGIIENIAQTAAALNGYVSRREGGTVRLGFIGGISNLEIFDLPSAGSRISTRVSELYYVMNTSIIEGEVRQGERVLARCEMKVFIQE